MSQRELRALQRDAAARAAEEREIAWQQLQAHYAGDCEFCGRKLAPPPRTAATRCACFGTFEDSIACGEYAAMNKFFAEVWRAS